jgi:MoaA/NifB/PqqE/SkfB family radical SAM enzyme
MEIGDHRGEARCEGIHQMISSNGGSGPLLRFHTGWRLLFRRILFVASGLKYVVRRSRYPLFFLNPAKGGALAAVKIARDLKLQKMIQFGDGYFTSPVLPRYPSRAYDRMVAMGGLNFAAAGTPLKQQISMILLGITRKCELHCMHCYERGNIGADDTIPISRWKEIIHELQNLGTGVIVLSGGEPMLRYDGILDLLQSGRKDLSDFHLHTSGLGVTLERARELRSAGLIAAAVGLDDVNPGRHDRLRGTKGSYQQAVAAIGAFYDAGILPYTNMCVTRELVRSGDLWKYYELAKELNVGMIEMLEPRPCGGFSSPANEVLLTPSERKEVLAFFEQANTSSAYKNYPLVYYVAYTEAPDKLGCMMGGLSHLTIDSRGNVNPCVFLPVTFGNIMTEDFAPIYKRMRSAIPRPVHKECPSVSLAGTIENCSRAVGGTPVPYERLAAEWEIAVKN